MIVSACFGIFRQIVGVIPRIIKLYMKRSFAQYCDFFYEIILLKSEQNARLSFIKTNVG